VGNALTVAEFWNGFFGQFPVAHGTLVRCKPVGFNGRLGEAGEGVTGLLMAFHTFRHEPIGILKGFIGVFVACRTRYLGGFVYLMIEFDFIGDQLQAWRYGKIITHMAFVARNILYAR
jgi:hypothetical protein